MLINCDNSLRIKSFHQIVSRNQLININPGDTIHHPNHGIGRVQTIRERSFSKDKDDTFAKLVFDRAGLALILRKADLAETVRVPIDKKIANQLLQHIENWDGAVRKEWKARALVNQSVMDRGDPFGYVDVYRGLSKLESEGSLRATDRDHLKHALELLVEELAYALGKTPDQARDLITKAATVAAAVAA